MPLCLQAAAEFAALQVRSQQVAVHFHDRPCVSSSKLASNSETPTSRWRPFLVRPTCFSHLLPKGPGDVAESALGAALHFVCDGALLAVADGHLVLHMHAAHPREQNKKISEDHWLSLWKLINICHFVYKQQQSLQHCSAQSAGCSSLFMTGPLPAASSRPSWSTAHQQMAAVSCEGQPASHTCCPRDGDVASGALGASAPLRL